MGCAARHIGSGVGGRNGCAVIVARGIPASEPFSADRNSSPPEHFLALTRGVVGLSACIPESPFEFREIALEPWQTHTSPIAVRLVSPSSSVHQVVVTHLPSRLHSDRPFEIALASVGLFGYVGAAESEARWMSTHGRVLLEEMGERCVSYAAPVTARPASGGWMARALIHPLSWHNATSVSVLSLTFAGRPLSCECLPATLLVGYNHAPAPAGAVLAAARAGDVPALQAALDAGGSTEEVDEVRFVDVWTREKIVEGPTSFPAILQNGFSALYYAASGRRLEALSTLLAAGANPAAASKVRGEKGASYALSGRL